MQQLKPWQSVVTRLVACLILGGLLVSAALSVMELNRSETALRMEIAQRIALVTRNLQAVLHDLLDKPASPDLEKALGVFTADDPIEAVRLQGPNLPKPVVLGFWPDQTHLSTHLWPVSEHGITTGREIAMDRLTLARAPFAHDGRVYMLELLVDGPAARAQMRHHILQRLAMQWLLLAVMVLMGLLLLRRWFTGPLSEVVELVHLSPGPAPFRRLARQKSGEFGQLAGAIAETLERIESTSRQLAQRERAFQSLYQFAPAAMVSLDAGGRIIEANRRAAALLGVEAESSLVGRPGLEFISDEDRPLLRQTIDRLAIDDAAQCELRVIAAGRRIDVAVEAAAVRDDDGLLQSVRLSLVDVSRSRQLQRQLEDKSRLLNLIIDHMSDAILLVDAQGRVAAFNQKLCGLLHRRPETLEGAAYRHDTFWDQLGVVDRELFVNRLRQIEADEHRPAQERFETRSGTYLFQGIPLHDAAAEQIGRLWVVQETTPQEQSQRLLNQQNRQLYVLKQVGRVLCDARGVDGVLQHSATQLLELLEVDAVGLAVRSGEGTRRCRQVIHRASNSLLLQTHQALTAAIERSLMPLVLPSRDVSFWPDLPTATPWGKAFAGAGLTCLAAGPLRGGRETHGLVWIARRGGERLERHHIHMLETLLPTIAARLEIVALEAHLARLELADHATALPSQEQFELALAHIAAVPGSRYAVLVLEIDHLARLAERAGEGIEDLVLGALAGRLDMAMRRSCFLARLGPATLGLLARDLSREAAASLANRLLQALAVQPVELPDGQHRTFTASIGVANSPDDGLDPLDLLRRARSRAEAARRTGRDQALASDPLPPDRQVG